jgi:hypothetical protein
MRDWLKALSLVGLIAGSPLAHAQEEGEGEIPVLTDADQATLAVMNAAIINGHILPAYRTFAAAGAALAAAAKAYCTVPDAAGLTKLRAAFGDASDGWQGVQHLRFGPSELFMRSSRLMFWPDPRDSVGRQLADLLGKGGDAFTPANLAKQSVSVQGLPALERLLFGDEAAALQCAAIQGIADNIAGLTAGLATDWTSGPIDYARVLQAPGPDNERYRSPSEVTMELFKSLHLAVEVVADRKLTKALGENAAAARPRLLEQWRSGRPLRNLELDLAAAKALWDSGMSAVVEQRNAPLAALVDKALAQTIASAGAITPPLETALADPARRAAVETVVNEAVALKAIIAQQLAPVLGIPLGFNALDGD